MNTICPECARPLGFSGQTVAARVDGRVHLFHRGCVPAGRAEADEPEPATVGGRMRRILAVDDEAGTRPADQESAADGAVAKGARR
jgi:hypothetical protein